MRVCVCACACAGKLEPIMRQALRDNKVSFVKLLLNNGVVMKNMINPKVLRELYNAVSCCARPSRGLINWH